MSINVDLEKVGLAADGGALVIGSMNKDYTNTFGKKSLLSTTDTVAGFDEFNVTVSGSKQESSSLSKLVSTDNTLRKVTIDSAAKSTANLTIGNSNTGAPITNAATAAAAFKDVQVVDASAFKGNLTLNAGITADITKKYLNNDAEVNFAEDTGLSFKGEVALFDYKGGAGNDDLNIFINNLALQTGTGKSVFITDNATTNPLTENVFKMNIDGGAGDDIITVKFDNALAIAAALDSITNISINGGAGNDTIDINSGTTATFTVAFNGNFGHDIIKGFNAGVVAVTDEKQALDLTGFVAHAGETLVITVGDKSTTFTADASGQFTVNSVSGLNLTQAVEAVLIKNSAVNPSNPEAPFDNGSTIAALVALNKDVNSVTVEVKSGSTVLNSAESVTTEQGGLYYSNVANVGADVLDFKAYKVKGVIVDRGTDLVATGTDLTAVGNKFIWLEASTHDAGVYNVYEATSKFAGITTVDFGTAGAATATTNNATKGAILGSIDLNDNGTLLGTSIDASQLVF
ncbi:hypothetical protein NG751_00870 [Aliarcobacter cryaerophilus]|uniref:hypothetical protein n=1 Tax=Aliarcobacter cryaerophilus TaxID=28198 RepID=UPI003DA4E566